MLIFYSECKSALIFYSSKYETVSNFCCNDAEFGRNKFILIFMYSWSKKCLQCRLCYMWNYFWKTLFKLEKYRRIICIYWRICVKKQEVGFWNKPKIRMECWDSGRGKMVSSHSLGWCRGKCIRKGFYPGKGVEA